MADDIQMHFFHSGIGSDTGEDISSLSGRHLTLTHDGVRVRRGFSGAAVDDARADSQRCSGLAFDAPDAEVIPGLLAE